MMMMTINDEQDDVSGDDAEAKSDNLMCWGLMMIQNWYLDWEQLLLSKAAWKIINSCSAGDCYQWQEGADE